MRRKLRVAAAALAFLLPMASADARTPVYVRTKCLGLYCRIVTEPAPRPAAPPQHPQKGRAPRRARKPERRRAATKRSGVVRRAAAIARRYPGVCKPSRVEECSPGCLCRAEARAESRR
jgi:hypothetical protein